ncbi:MAG: OsmC family protein [Chloroflexi bacterium]|nr:OsmC family protein [Chloroflexota bacterium]
MTKTVIVRWTGNEREFIAESENGGFAGINAMNPPEQGMSASELLLAALGGCMGTTIIAVLLKRRLPVESFEVEVRGNHIPDWPKTFTSYHLTYRVKGEGITEKIMERAAWLAKERYCTVSSSLAGEITQEIEIESD